MHLNWSRAHPYRGNLEGCAHSWDWVGRAISHGGAGYHRHYPTHHPQFGELLRARKRHLAVFQHQNLSFHNPFSVGYDSVSKPVVSRLFIWNESEARIGCCSDNGSVLLNVSLLWRAFGYCRLLWNLCCLFQLWSFFKSNYNIFPYFPHHQYQMGRNRLQMGSKEVCSAWLPLPTSTLVEEVEK